MESKEEAAPARRQEDNNALGTMALSVTAGRFLTILYLLKLQEILYIHDFMESKLSLAMCGAEAFFSSLSF